MPAPFDIPLMVIVLPAIEMVLDTPFGKVSVVIIALAALSQLSLLS